MWLWDCLLTHPEGRALLESNPSAVVGDGVMGRGCFLLPFRLLPRIISDSSSLCPQCGKLIARPSFHRMAIILSVMR